MQTRNEMTKFGVECVYPWAHNTTYVYNIICKYEYICKKLKIYPKYNITCKYIF